MESISTPSFTPDSGTMKECSYFVLAKVTNSETGEDRITGAVATDYSGVPEAISTAFYGFRKEPLSPSEQGIIAATCKHLEISEGWVVNETCGAPLLSSGHFQDGAWVVEITLIALIDALHEGVRASMKENFATPSQIVGGAMLDSLMTRAQGDGSVPFIGVISPDVFGEFFSAALNSDRLSLTLLETAGESASLTPDYSGSSDRDTLMEVEIAYFPIDEENCRTEDILESYGWFKDISHRHEDELLYVKVVSTKEKIMQAIDCTTERFIGIHTFGIAG